MPRLTPPHLIGRWMVSQLHIIIFLCSFYWRIQTPVGVRVMLGFSYRSARWSAVWEAGTRQAPSRSYCEVGVVSFTLIRRPASTIHDNVKGAAIECGAIRHQQAFPFLFHIPQIHGKGLGLFES